MNSLECSTPFLSVDFFIGLADCRILAEGDQIDTKAPRKAQGRRPVLFVKTQLLESYIPSLLQLDYDYILLVGCNDDMCVPYGSYPCMDSARKTLYDTFLESDHLVRLYSKNICISHPKLCALPIGPKMQWVSDQFFGEPKEPVLALYRQYYMDPLQKLKDSLRKPNLLYSNITVQTTAFTFYSMHTGIRSKIVDMLHKNGFPLSPPVENEVYIRNLQSHKFCISPPGRGIDAHRTWEALMVGTIPICLSSSLDAIYAKLPVLIVKDYSIITETYLLEQYKRLQSKTYDFSILYTGYWTKHLLGLVPVQRPVEPTVQAPVAQAPVVQAPVAQAPVVQAPVAQGQLGKESYTAIMIEPRQHRAMRFVLQNFLENLDSRWNFIIYHGIDNEQWLKALVTNVFPESLSRITFRKAAVNTLTLDQYSSIMVNPQFIQTIPTEMYLVFQTDSMICKPYKDLIYDFMEYDYVGAPWHEVVRPPWTTQVGNGGLSLRRRSKMLEIARNIPYSYGYPEDMYFSEGADKLQMKKPTWAKAREFSIETQPNSKSFGVHRPWIWTLVTEEQCPGYQELVKLNSKPNVDVSISV